MKIVKEVIRKKERDTFDSIPKKSIIDQVEIADTKTSNKTFNNLFVNSGPNLASKNKQFGFRKGHSTKHALIELVKRM